MRILYRLSFSAVLCIFLTGFLAQSQAQSILHHSDIAVSGFAQRTPSVTGNGVAVSTTDSAGGQAAFRHSYHWWMGFEGSYNYTRFSEHYSAYPYAVQHNMHEFAGSYLVSGASVLGFRPFALGGVSAVVFSPSLNGGQKVSWQARPGLNFGAGIDRALFTSHFGLRLQYRGVYYKTPDFGDADLDTGKYRLTSEPMAGLYLRF